MPADAVITVENLGKRYTLRHQAAQGLFRDKLAHSLRAPLRWLTRSSTPAAPTEEEFWALRDVNFSINRGDVVGIIGRNGAGKSTLLKILSRITEPTTGRVRIRGRIASLLEVGTGFHPELSGRENIFLNGAVLGMTRTEIRRKFDEIVAFAEVERFLDTPVKHYSSGMYVRLAFAVAAHLEPEILIVDEVLAVGDAAFQKKCLGKMDEVARTSGRTVLFVSHNLHAVRQLCGSALLLQQGRIQAVGRTSQLLDLYAHGLAGPDLLRIPAPTEDLLARAYITAVFVEDNAGSSVAELAVGVCWRVRVVFRAARTLENFVVALGLVASDGTAIQTVWEQPRSLPAGEYEAIFQQDRVTLAAGSYTVLVGLTEREQSIQQLEAARLHISADHAVGYYQATSGVGAVLNSMSVAVRKL
jgi:lipopolysaccharide transport system ATP-binding protein